MNQNIIFELFFVPNNEFKLVFFLQIFVFFHQNKPINN